MDLFATTLGVLDSERPTGRDPRFKPGIGPLTENEVTALLVNRLRTEQGGPFSKAGARRYPASRTECDLVIPDEWAIEIKLARPFGDNGKLAERWSENLLYPYPGNTSSLGDALKLLTSGFKERRAIVIFGYEHSPPKLPIEPAVRGMELLAADVLGISLGVRHQRSVGGLIHPSHQQVTVFAWEVVGHLNHS